MLRLGLLSCGRVPHFALRLVHRPSTQRFQLRLLGHRVGSLRSVGLRWLDVVCDYGSPTNVADVVVVPGRPLAIETPGRGAPVLHELGIKSCEARLLDADVRGPSLPLPSAGAHHEIEPPGGHLLAFGVLIPSLYHLRYVFCDGLEQEHQELVRLAVWCLLDLREHLLELLALDLRTEEHERPQYGNPVGLVLLSGTVPHHVDLLLSNAVVVVEELEEEVALFDDLRMEALAEHHVEDAVLIHPLYQGVLRQPPLSEVLDGLQMVALPGRGEAS